MKLTPKQLKVLSLLGKGLTVAEVAASLSLKPGTVRTHVNGIHHRLKARNNVQAVVIAIRKGYVSLDGSTVAEEVEVVAEQSAVLPPNLCYVCKHTVYDLEKHQLTEDHRRNARRMIEELREQLDAEIS